MNGRSQDEISLSVRCLSKKFCKNLRRSIFYGITDVIKSAAGIRPNTSDIRKEEFWAVNDISFKMQKGETLGIIGSNGSGKTTLLRMLASILTPDRGEALIQGRRASLLSMGIGFHPYMTVKENIYINGTILGMSREEIDEMFDFIIEFSGVKDFVYAPAGALSAGMNVKLGFSIAVAVQPDIFLIDEVLAVGDRKFREKCISEITKSCGKSIIIFISHNMDMVRRICNRIMVMEKGEIVYDGSDVEKGIEKYN